MSRSVLNQPRQEETPSDEESSDDEVASEQQRTQGNRRPQSTAVTSRQQQQSRTQQPQSTLQYRTAVQYQTVRASSGVATSHATHSQQNPARQSGSRVAAPQQNVTVQQSTASQQSAPALARSVAATTNERQLVELLKIALLDEVSRQGLANSINGAAANANDGRTTLSTDVIQEAIQVAAPRLAQIVSVNVSPVMAWAFQQARDAPYNSELPNETPQNFQTMMAFLTNHLRRLPTLPYSPNVARAQQERVAAVASRAVGMAIGNNQSGISSRLVPGAATLATYNAIAFCDNSRSMRDFEGGIRRVQMKDVLTLLMSILKAFGIGFGIGEPLVLRMLNAQPDRAERIPIRSLEDLDTWYRGTNWDGATPLGDRFNESIVEQEIVPLARARALVPTIIYIITDGEPNSEKSYNLQTAIERCERKLRQYEYPRGTIVYILCRVGDSREARTFVEGIRNNGSLAGVVYAHPDDIGAQMSAYSGNSFINQMIRVSLNAVSAIMGRR